MSTRVKKQRRIDGVKFSKPAKVPTPLEDRRAFRTMVRQPWGLRNGGMLVPRSPKKLKALREAWGIA